MGLIFCFFLLLLLLDLVAFFLFAPLEISDERGRKHKSLPDKKKIADERALKIAGRIRVAMPARMPSLGLVRFLCSAV